MGVLWEILQSVIVFLCLLSEKTYSRVFKIFSPFVKIAFFTSLQIAPIVFSAIINLVIFKF